MTLTRLLLRRHRLLLACWPVLLIALCATTTAYQQTYATEAQRRTAVELAQQNAANTLLYGRLPDPGDPAQMFAWEIGAFVTILTAVMAVLVAVAVTRAAEDDGSLELLRGCGIGPLQPLRSALTVLAGVAGVLTAGSAAAILATAGSAGGVSGSGAAAFAAVVGVTFLVVAAVAVVAAQVAPTAGMARLLGFALLGAAFVIRAVADTEQLAALNWVSPLGLRAVVEPFTADRWAALLPALLTAAALTATAVLLCARREFGAGLIRRHDTRAGRLRIHTSVGLAARLTRSSLLVWTITVAAIGALFAAMGSGAVEQQHDGEVGGFLGSQLGDADPAAGFLAYCGTLVGIVVSVFAILSMLAAGRSEQNGLTGLVLAAGVRRWMPLTAQAVVTVVNCAVVLTVTGLLTAMVAPAFLDGTDIAARSLAYMIGQWPAAVAATGGAALLLGAFPRLAALAWLPLLVSGVLALLGDLLGVPDRVRDLGLFQQVPDIAGPAPQAGALLVLTGLGAALVLAGAAGATRRDVLAG
jgi:ABC-2 type transport system permease protein